jgi:hypothetical protein
MRAEKQPLPGYLFFLYLNSNELHDGIILEVDDQWAYAKRIARWQAADRILNFAK